MSPSLHLWFMHAKQRLLDQIISLYGSQPSSVVLCIQNNVISIRITSLNESQPSSVVFACKTTTFGSDYKPLWVPALICGLCMQNSNFWIRITSLSGSQPSSVVLCIQNNVISIRITSLNGSQPSSEVFACKTATFGSELQASLGPSHHLCFCAFKTM